jgi:hypothetical protein
MLQLPSVRRWARSQAATYRHGEERPLAGYLLLLGFYAAGAAAAEALIRMLNRTPARWSPWELNPTRAGHPQGFAVDRKGCDHQPAAGSVHLLRGRCRAWRG